MTTLSELFPQSGAVSSIQTGYVSGNNVTSTGSGETLNYFDVTISAVDATKCKLDFQGSMAIGASAAGFYSDNANTIFIPTLQLTSSTNLRISASETGIDSIRGRWTVVEYA